MAFNLSNEEEMAGPMASLYIQRGSCAYISAKCKRLQLYNTLAQLLGRMSSPIDSPISAKQTPRVNRSMAALDDYMYRPEKQKRVGLYKFSMKHFWGRITKSTSKQVLFQLRHPPVDTYCLGTHSRELVLVILGPSMPYTNEDLTEDVIALRSRIALVLFKPFRGLLNLVGT
ncbi:hypothetical protein PHMEG_0005235 [Phytophthora megakarya]|uniref:Uncharacterized protein n=1 Tax=Phytophthora megakarya TaxID=4795 RepID=A0A225WRT2_9STRA|nr:hypothetical protein PHMEG_0005235 [Phytophthora megakarya]